MSTLVYRPRHPAANHNGMVPKGLAMSRVVSAVNVVSDIASFVTQEGIEITSRSGLRAYEQARSIRQCGNDWSGPEKPAFWDSAGARKRREI